MYDCRVEAEIRSLLLIRCYIICAFVGMEDETKGKKKGVNEFASRSEHMRCSFPSTNRVARSGISRDVEVTRDVEDQFG